MDGNWEEEVERKNKGRKVVGEGKIGDKGIILCNCTLKSEL